MIRILAILLGLAALPAWAQESAYLFEGATVITMDGDQLLKDASVVVRGDRIVAVGAGATLDGASRIDARGKFLLPGLAEMHGHLPGDGSDAETGEDILFLYVARGVTTVRGMQGSASQFGLRERIAGGGIIGPNLYLAGPSFNGRVISSPDQARALVVEQAAAGWDLLKVHEGLSLAEYDAMAEAAAKAGIPFGGHVPDDVGLERALAAGQGTIDHMDGFLELFDGDKRDLTTADLDRAAALLKTAGAWIVPTGLLFERFLAGPAPGVLEALPELRYMAPGLVRGWSDRYRRIQTRGQGEAAEGRRAAANRRLLLRGLADRGAGILLGSDAPQLFSVPGFSILSEMEFMAAAGMSTAAILRSGTVNPGIYFRDHDRFGMIRVGMRADILLLDADPLADIANIRRQAGVMVSGRWYPAELIAARLERIAKRRARR